MLLSELFEQLTYGELSNLKIGGKSLGDIEAGSYPAIVSHVNMGLTALHKLFPLSCKEIVVQQYEDIGVYKLHTDFAVNGTTGSEATKYLIDTAASPFENTVLMIDKVVDENANTLFLNELTETKSLFTPSYNTLQVPNPTTSVLGVTYRAKHATIEADNLEPETVELVIPESLLEPLLYYIASRAFMGTPAIDGVDRSALYFGRYQASIARFKEEGLINNDTYENKRLVDHGWA